MEIIENMFWTFYINKDEVAKLDDKKVGKWMYFFTKDGIDFVEDICKNAVENNIVVEAKHTSLGAFGLNPNATTSDSGVACFYLNIDDLDGHKHIINYFIENNMIRKTKTGKYYNNSFKLDNQTLANEYGESFNSVLKLSDLIDLTTGEWIAN